MWDWHGEFGQKVRGEPDRCVPPVGEKRKKKREGGGAAG
jgi:hypothetical protein